MYKSTYIFKSDPKTCKPDTKMYTNIKICWYEIAKDIYLSLPSQDCPVCVALARHTGREMKILKHLGESHMLGYRKPQSS